MANIRVAELDFDAIKLNIKNHLKSQTEFSDYDFEGSGLSVLIDILAYNTHYNAYLANMLANEMFLDSAVKRESAVSLAKHLSYVTRSVIGAVAKVNITYASQPGNPASLTIPQYSVFQTTINNSIYRFVNLEPLTALNNAGQYIFEDVDLKEGVHVTNTHTAVNPGPAEKYELFNKNADVTTVRVRVQNSISDTTTIAYTNAAEMDMTEITGDSTVFFIEENVYGKYEVYFGDGNVGKKLGPGNLIFIDYIVSNGTKSNVSSTLGASQTFSGPSLNSVTPTIVTTESSNGGRDREAIDEIKFNAPRAYASQNRLVTVEDYRSIIKRYVNNVKAVSVWGGQDNDPPEYGKVFISILPTSGSALTPSVKTRIINNILGGKRVVAITPVIVDPDFFYVNVESTVKYNSLVTIKTPDQIRALVENKINSYFTDKLENFNQTFLYSKFLSEIDSADTSILGNQTNIKLQKRIVPSLKIANSNRIKFNNILHAGTLESTRFVWEKNNTLVQARIRDIEDTATIEKTGTYRRSGSIITCTFTSAHRLTEDEEVYLDFTGAAVPGNYTIYKVLSPTSFSVISTVTGSTSGSVYVTSKPRGDLQLYNPVNQEVLLSSVGFVSYEEGIVQLDNLYVKGFFQQATDIRITVEVAEGSRDVVFYRNQIPLLDDSIANSALDRQAGLTVTIVPVNS